MVETIITILSASPVLGALGWILKFFAIFKKNNTENEEKKKKIRHLFAINLKQYVLFILGFLCFALAFPQEIMTAFQMDMSTTYGQFALNYAPLISSLIALVSILLILRSFIFIQNKKDPYKQWSLLTNLAVHFFIPLIVFALSLYVTPCNTSAQYFSLIGMLFLNILSYRYSTTNFFYLFQIFVIILSFLTVFFCQSLAPFFLFYGLEIVLWEIDYCIRKKVGFRHSIYILFLILILPAIATYLFAFIFKYDINHILFFGSAINLMLLFNPNKLTYEKLVQQDDKRKNENRKKEEIKKGSAIYYDMQLEEILKSYEDIDD